jgi:C-terminal processing protease CtpA/Prc
VFVVQLNRGAKGFGFSIRGGREFGQMPLFVLKIADGGPADEDGRLRVGDLLVEINGVDTTVSLSNILTYKILFPVQEMTHEQAIQIIRQSSIVRLVVRRVSPAMSTQQTGYGKFLTSF